MAYLTEFGGCCGINIIEDFWHTCKEEEKELKLSLKDHMSTGAGMVLISLNKKQKTKYHRMLLRNGFEVLQDKFPNPRHKGSMITLYRMLTPDAKVVEPEWW